MEKTKTSPLSFIKKWCYDKRLYFLVFFLPVAIMFSAYAFFKIHPIGDSSVLVLDLNGQMFHFCLAHLLILYRCKETVPSPYQ
jgi:uncharacterized membrane protein YfhO